MVSTKSCGIWAGVIAAAFAVISPGPLTAAGIERSATIRLQATVFIASEVPNATPLTGRATVALIDAGGTRLAAVTDVLHRSGNTATTTFVIPYSWTLEDRDRLLTVSLSVSTPTAIGRAARAGVVVAQPANGGTRLLKLSASI